MFGADPGASLFHCSDGERATFEAGIKLGAIYHQYIGTPVAPSTAARVERTIEDATRLQPFVEGIRVRILRKPLRRALTAYGYASLSPDMLQVILRVRYGTAEAVCELRHLAKHGYPLMFVRSVRTGEDRGSSRKS
jgi:hypothetical protein